MTAAVQMKHYDSDDLFGSNTCLKEEGMDCDGVTLIEIQLKHGTTEQEKNSILRECFEKISVDANYEIYIHRYIHTNNTQKGT